MSNDGEITPLNEAAVQLHEMYLSLQTAGFTRGESMELIARVMASGMTGDSDDDD